MLLERDFQTASSDALLRLIDIVDAEDLRRTLSEIIKERGISYNQYSFIHDICVKALTPKGIYE